MYTTNCKILSTFNRSFNTHKVYQQITIEVIVGQANCK